MSFKEQLDNAAEQVKDAFKHGVDDMKDAVNEARHRRDRKSVV